MKLTEKQIQKGYWYYNPTENFPPNGKLLEEYDGEENLNLIITKSNETDNEIKKRERTYSSNFPIELKSIKILWVYHINQDIFNAICGLENLTSLYIQSNRIKEISALSNLKNLRHLALLNLTKVDSIQPISELNQMITLKFENFKRINNFKAISSLNTLKGLQIDGGMYSAQKINDFEFLSNLTDLEYLTFINSQAILKDLSPILKLTNLKMLQCSSNYPKKEFKKLNEMKSLKYVGGNIKPLINGKS